MKKFLNKVSIHPLFIIYIFIFILIGRFRFLIFYTLLLSIHELGHIVISLILKWNIESILILPFGCLIKFREKINRPLIEEFLISISGILFQYLFYIIFKDYTSYNYFPIINYFIIIFNLVPIHPLDGSKIVNVVLNYISNFYKSLNITIFISYFLLGIVSLYFLNNNRLILITFYFLIREVNRLNSSKNSIFNKFLLERYLNNFEFKRRKTISNIKNMKRDYVHLFFLNNKYKTEREVLKKIFNK